MAYAPPQRVGDRHPLIPAAKAYLHSGKFSYCPKGSLGTTDVYTGEFGVVLRQWEAATHYQVVFKGRPGPDVLVQGIFDWRDQRQMGLLDPPPEQKGLPWIVTVAGHLGAWDSGPAYLTARWLEEHGLARVQAVGYDNVSIPFQSQTGSVELDRVVREVVPADTPGLVICGHSQGSIIVSDYLEKVVLPGKARGEKPFTAFKGGLLFGNPRAPVGVVAPWITDPPPPDSEGLDPDCLDGPIPGVAEVRRRGDLYADKRRSEAAEYGQAVYLAVAKGQLFGKDSLAEQLGELATDFGPEVWAMVSEMVAGVTFAVNMDAHNVFDLGPCVTHLRQVLAV